MNEIMVVLTNAVPGEDDEYNEWYTDRHLADVLALDGFVPAQRFEITPVEGAAEPAYRYLAIYEIEPGGPTPPVPRSPQDATRAQWRSHPAWTATPCRRRSSVRSPIDWLPTTVRPDCESLWHRSD